MGFGMLLNFYDKGSESTHSICLGCETVIYLPFKPTNRLTIASQFLEIDNVLV